MFWRNFKNCIKVIVKSKISLFWTLVFPIALATFMYVAFADIVEKDEMFKNIDVAVVSSGEEENGLMYVIDALSEGEDKLLNVKEMSGEAAKQALSDGEVKGIIFTDDVSLMVSESSANASILEGILNSYKQNEYAIRDIMGDRQTPPNEAEIMEMMSDIMTDVSYYTEKSTTDSNQNIYYNYFYAIFAMSCLFAAYSSVAAINNLQANESGRGMRKCISPNSKIVFIVSEFLALLVIHFVVELIALFYMSVVLGIDFGDKYPAIILTLLVGSMIGLAIGVIVGAVSKIGDGGKIGVVTALGLVLSGMADLFVNGVKRAIELNVPIINKINPAALISDCFYSLNVYGDYSAFIQNIVIMAVESVILIVIAFMMIRRNKYASI